MQEVRRAVERIDDPAVMRVAARALAAFLEQQPIAGAGTRQLVLQGALGLQIGGRDEFARTLDRDLQLLDFAEIADEAAGRLEGGAGHHVDYRRAYRHEQSRGPTEGNDARTMITGCRRTNRMRCIKT